MTPFSKKYRLVIFDFDGTLVDTAPDIAHYANEVLGAYGFGRKSLPEVKRAVGRGVHELLRDLGFSAHEEKLEEAVLKFKQSYGKKPVLTTEPYAGVLDLLDKTLASAHKAIATNKPHDLTLKILDILSLRPKFNHVLGAGQGLAHKPDPAILRAILKDSGIGPGETLFVGDSLVDRDTAKNAGVDFAAVTYGYDEQISKQGGLVSFESIQGLRLWLEKRIVVK